MVRFITSVNSIYHFIFMSLTFAIILVNYKTVIERFKPLKDLKERDCSIGTHWQMLKS